MAKKVNLPVDLESIYNDYIKYENDVNVFYVKNYNENHFRP